MSYVIAGRAIKNEYLVLGTIASAVGIAMTSMGGEKKPAPIEQAKDIEASSSEEEEFIRNFVAEAEKNEGSAPAKH